jgi:serine/threonine protein kinase
MDAERKFSDVDFKPQLFGEGSAIDPKTCWWAKKEFCTAKKGTGCVFMRKGFQISEVDFKNKDKTKVLEHIFADVLKTLTVLHSNDIVHTDIRPANILRFKGSNGKFFYQLIDYGLSAVAESSVDVQYRSQEVLARSARTEVDEITWYPCYDIEMLFTAVMVFIKKS